MTETTIASGSNGQALPQVIINVTSTTGFAASGTFVISITGSPQTITYTTIVSNTFTGCTGGTGTLVTGQYVLQSVDNGISEQLDGYKGFPASSLVGIRSSNSRGVYDFIGFSTLDDRGSSSTLKYISNLPAIPVVGVKYYKMVGYYVTGAVYESFVSIGAPSASSTTNPNTSHALINTYVSSFWIV